MRQPPRPPSGAAPATPIADVRTYRFLTPVFGGGVQVDGQKKPRDEVTPVRVPSIRGQLRFWWRACNRGEHQDPAPLFKAEEKVFGSTKAPSPLSIAVVQLPQRARDVSVLRDRFAVVDERHGRAYGAFPLRDTPLRDPLLRDIPLRDTGTSGIDHGVLHDHPGEWTLALRYPDEIAEDVEAALWAWAHFGGLGGRTRRGFGAVEEVRRARGVLPTVDAGWRRFVSGVDVPWPHLPAFEARRLRAKSAGWKAGADAQEYLLGVMRRLRQVDIGRRRDADDVPGRHPGRSYWPEADAIRKLTGMSSPDHRKPVTQSDAFPRAAFGLPIIFHFKDRSDPPDTTLLPEVNGQVKGRLASPLILRPHRAPDGSVEALALVLAHPAPTRLVLLDRKKPPIPVPRWRADPREAVNLGLGGRPSPFVTAGGAVIADPIDRFLEEIR